MTTFPPHVCRWRTAQRRTLAIAALTLTVAGMLAACTQTTRPPSRSGPTGTHTATSAASPTGTTTPAPTATPSNTTTVPRVLSSRVALDWFWQTHVRPGRVTHTYPVPPLPSLRAIAVGRHEDARPSYDRISFMFAGTFPSYEITWVRTPLTADPSGRAVPIEGDGVLRIRFIGATAHDESGASTVLSTPPAHVGYKAIAAWAAAGDYEGVLTYGVSHYRLVRESNGTPMVRAVEVSTTGNGSGLRYIVAIDIQTSGLGNPADCPTAPALHAALPPAIRAVFTDLHNPDCSDGWAIATGSQPGQDRTFMFRLLNQHWTYIDRGTACRAGEVPGALWRLGCQYAH